MHTGTSRAFATPDPGMSSSRPEGPCGGMLGGAQDEKLGGVMGDETDGHDGDTDDDERQGGGDEDSDHDSISHVVLGTKRKRAPPLHSSSSSDTEHNLFITQLPVSRKRASPHELGEGSSSASHEEGVCGTGDADGASTEEEAPPKKLKRQEEELHHRYQNKSRTAKGPKQCGPRPSSPKARRLPPPLIEQYQGAAVWGLLACSKQLKQQHWSKYIQQICNVPRARTLSESEDNIFLANSFEALVEDMDENVGEEMCGEGGVDGTDRVEIRVVVRPISPQHPARDPNSFILNVVSDAKPALSTKSQAKTVTASQTGRAKPNKKRKRPREKRKQKT
uniref:Uncharacterized protein LOC116950253 isoform X1 n=2 Tax=Petromyzon marinus TaxID=7757 RepID=A0AAJ7TW98_PETMA|nr:uncharacterized protein LOC116950253 isoform X1 [Petromyzon marinus]